MVIYNQYCRLSRYDSSASVGGSSHSAVSPLGCDWHGFRKDISKSDSNGFPDRCSDETAYSTGIESVARALELLVNQYDWLPGPLRSEEHTSELQSPCNLVCRLLLEKKNKQTTSQCSLPLSDVCS